MTKSSEKRYKQLHEHRIHLRCEGLLSDKENENIKKKIESWGRKNKVETVGEYLATIDKFNKAKESQLNTK